MLQNRKYNRFIACCILIFMLLCSDVSSNAVSMACDRSSSLVSPHEYQLVFDEITDEPVWVLVANERLYSVVDKWFGLSGSSTLSRIEARLHRLLMRCTPLKYILDRDSQAIKTHIDEASIVTWRSPDGKTRYAGYRPPLEGLSWNSNVAHAVKDFLIETYGDAYQFDGEILGCLATDDGRMLWVAPIDPVNRFVAAPEGQGTENEGLDCVGFVNGWYYLYTTAMAGGDYRLLEQDILETGGVYGAHNTPSTRYAFYPWVVIKPAMDGTYADINQIRPGDMHESAYHVWLVSDDGQGLESAIWEYCYEDGFHDQRILFDLPHTLYNDEGTYNTGYRTSTIISTLEQYATINLHSTDAQGRPNDEQMYQIVDAWGNTLNILGSDGNYQAYRPTGEEFFLSGYDAYHNDWKFFNEDSTFHTNNGSATIRNIIGSEYRIFSNGIAISEPFTIKPGEMLTIKINQQKP